MPHHCCIYLRIKISHPLKKLTKYEGSYDFFPTMAVTSYPDLGPWHKENNVYISSLLNPRKLQYRVLFNEGEARVK